MQAVKQFMDLFGFGESTFGKFLFATFACLAMVLAVMSIITQISKLIGKPVHWAKAKELDHDLLVDVEHRVAQLEQHQDQDRTESVKHDEKIQRRQEQIYQMVLNRDIKDMRWSILDFASRISSNSRATKQQYDHILDTYTEYEELLKQHGMANGKVDASMQVIRKKYQEHLENGF